MTTTQNDLVLVTGASGWLGRRLIRALTEGHPEMGPFRAGGRRVRMPVRPDDKVDDLLALKAEKVEGDFCDPTARSLVAGAAGATLIHLAGIIYPTRGTREFKEVNVEGTKTIVSEAGKAGIRRAIVISFEVFDEASPYNPYMG